MKLNKISKLNKFPKCFLFKLQGKNKNVPTVLSFVLSRGNKISLFSLADFHQLVCYSSEVLE